MDKAKPYFIAGAAFIAYGAYKCIEEYVLSDIIAQKIAFLSKKALIVNKHGGNYGYAGIMATRDDLFSI